MKFKSTTYRIFSALVLMLFLSSIVLPSGLSAATLLCDMPMAEKQHNPQDCCAPESAEETTHHRENSEDDACQREKICMHNLSPGQAEVEAVVLQHAKKLAVIAYTSDVIFAEDSGKNTSHPSLEPTITDSSPPIFLLNTTFLN